MVWTPIKLRRRGEIAFICEAEGAGGGSLPGAVRHLAFPFDFTMAAALADGVPVSVWTPAPGDWLHDAWVETIDPGWPDDGTVTPFCDIGVVKAGVWANFDGGAQGFLARYFGAVPLADSSWTADTELIAYGRQSSVTGLLQAMLMGYTANALGAMPVGVKWRTADPLSVVVSGDGTPGAAAYDGSAGESVLNIIVATPGFA